MRIACSGNGLTLAAAAAAALLALATPAQGNAAGSGPYQVRNLVSDGGVPAAHKDKDLVNGWGIAFGPGTLAWVADNGTGLSTIYDGKGKKAPLVVTIPEGAPTGIVSNPTGTFAVGRGKKSASSFFLFASEAGVISGWAASVDLNHALIGFKAKDGAIYKGLVQRRIQRMHAWARAQERFPAFCLGESQAGPA